MRNSRMIVTLLGAVLAVFPARNLRGQSWTSAPVWETLMQEPLPEDSEAKIRVFSIPIPPALPLPDATGAGHTHAGPVFAYILDGQIENQVEPDSPGIYKRGD